MSGQKCRKSRRECPRSEKRCGYRSRRNLYTTDAEYGAARQNGTLTHAFLYRAVEILFQVRHEHVATVYGRRNIAGFACGLARGSRNGRFSAKNPNRRLTRRTVARDDRAAAAGADRRLLPTPP